MFLEKISIEDLRLWYLNIIIILSFLLGLYKLSLIMLLFKLGYWLTKLNIIQDINEYIYDDIERDDVYYHDHDVDNMYLYNLWNEELYLIYNCRFFFYYYGGQAALSLDDYYILNNIYYNIYNNLYIMEDFNNEDFELNNEDYIKSYKIKYYMLNIFFNYNKEKHNLINSTFYVYLLKNKKLIELYKKYNKN